MVHDAGKMKVLADELTMFASQIGESAAGQGSHVNPWHIDDWLVRYRTALEGDHA